MVCIWYLRSSHRKLCLEYALNNICGANDWFQKIYLVYTCKKTPSCVYFSSPKLWLLLVNRVSLMLCCCSSVAQSCPTLCDPMDYSMPGFPVPHHLLEFAQVHVHWVDDAIQPSHPPSPSSPLPSIFHSIRVFTNEFTSGGQNIGASASTSVLPENIEGWFPLRLTSLISLFSKGFSIVFSGTTVQKHQFFSTLSLSSPRIYTWLLEIP